MGVVRAREGSCRRGRGEATEEENGGSGEGEGEGEGLSVRGGDGKGMMVSAEEREQSVAGEGGLELEGPYGHQIANGIKVAASPLSVDDDVF